MSVYGAFLIIFFGLPLLVIMAAHRDIFRYRRTFLWSLASVYTIGWLWDWVSVKTGVWRYDSAETLGFWISGIPIEEFIGFYILGTSLIVSVAVLFLLRFRTKTHVR